MSNNLNKEALNNWSLVATINQALLSEEASSKIQISEFKGIKEDLPLETKAFNSIVGDQLSSDMLANFEAGTPLSVEQQQQLAKVADEFRVFFLLTMIASRTLSSDHQDNLDLLAILEGQKPFPTSTIHHGQGGVTYCKIDSNCFILMPKIDSPKQGQLILKELLNIFNLTEHNALWVIDFSLVQEFSLSIIGTLIGYTTGSSSRRLTACWLRDEIIPLPVRAGIPDDFNCRKIGSFWFPKEDL